MVSATPALAEKRNSEIFPTGCGECLLVLLPNFISRREDDQGLVSSRRGDIVAFQLTHVSVQDPQSPRVLRCGRLQLTSRSSAT